MFSAFGTGSYTDATIPDTGNNYEIAILEVSVSGNDGQFALRPDGETSYPDHYYDGRREATGWQLMSLSSDILR